jgi:hypothetical protein
LASRVRLGSTTLSCGARYLGNQHMPDSGYHCYV